MMERAKVGRGGWRRLVVVAAAAVVMVMMTGKGEAQLLQNFYANSCPNVEAIVREVVITKINQTFATIPATLRLFFHDCFVQGCDASIMISSPNHDAEKDANENLSLAGDGFDTVVKAKQAVEAVCSVVVSCADIIAIAARDVVFLSGGPLFTVELGRRDGLVSKASLVAGNIPESNFDLNQLNQLFSQKNLTQIDMIALSGAHTVGFSHCDQFSNRLYSASTLDPSLNEEYAQQLIGACPQNVDPNIATDLDPVTPQVFDNMYYQNLVQGKGLLSSDEALFTDPASQSTVIDFATNPSDFNAAFINAMIKLGRVGVKTGFQGEIRTDCTAFNSPNN